MSDNIPSEIVVEILSRLPVVSLLRFKSVCKSWHSLITNPSFVSKHLNHSKTKSQNLLLRRFTKGFFRNKEHYLLWSENDGKFGDEFSKMDFPFIIPRNVLFPYFRIVGSCNGILCLIQDFTSSTTRIILWNPSIRKSFTLPEESQIWGMFIVGFGAHPTTQEYKVVRIVYESSDPSQPEITSRTKAEIYTQGMGSWRAIGSILTPYCHIEPRASQAIVNGVVNWIATDSLEYVGYRNSILSFDMGAETFAVMMLPPMLINHRREPLSIKVFQGSLAVLCDQQMDDGACCIWVMKEFGVPDSWTKLFNFKLDLPVILRRVLGFWKHGEVLITTGDNRLLSYDIGRKALKDIGIRGTALAFHVEPFVESLVSLENQNGALDGGSNPLYRFFSIPLLSYIFNR